MVDSLFMSNAFVLVVLFGALNHSKDKSLQITMIGVYVMVMIADLSVPLAPYTPHYEGHHGLMMFIYLFVSCGIYVKSDKPYMLIYSLILVVQCLLSALMLLKFDFVYGLAGWLNGAHGESYGTILVIELILAWFAAAKSRKG